MTSLLIVITVARPIWSSAVGRSLVCGGQPGSADAILVENLDPNYLLFERAGELYRANALSRVYVLANANAGGVPSSVDLGVINVMAQIARLAPFKVVPVSDVEPISLNAAKQARTVLHQERVKSVLIVTTAFRSRRSSLVYRAVFGQAGIDVACVPVLGHNTPDNWTDTWHGIEEVVEQFVKLQYYRFYVLPRYS